MRLLATLLLFASFNAFGAQPAPLPLAECAIHAPYGFPTVKRQNVTTICREGYVTVHDNAAKIPMYSAYVMLPFNVATACNARDNTFEADASLKADERGTPKDYAKSGYDIGHMVSAEDLKYSEVAQTVAALISNAAPQLPELNRGIWKKLEDTTRGWALSRQHPLLVYVGPVYDKQGLAETIGKNRVVVPHAFYKILVDLKTKEVQVFLFKHEGSKEKLDTFITSLANVQKQTGIVFPMPETPKFGAWPIIMKSASRTKAQTCSLQFRK